MVWSGSIVVPQSQGVVGAITEEKGRKEEEGGTCEALAQTLEEIRVRQTKQIPSLEFQMSLVFPKFVDGIRGWEDRAYLEQLVGINN